MGREIIERMFRHLEWANQHVLALVERDPRNSEPAMGVLAHMFAAERVWLLRIRGENSRSQAVWPTLSREAMVAMAAETSVGYAGLLAGATDDDLARVVTYTNQSGRTFLTRVDDILIHVATHGAYHRGQIAASVRRAGGEPVNTDYITYVRELGDPVT